MTAFASPHSVPVHVVAPGTIRTRGVVQFMVGEDYRRIQAVVVVAIGTAARTVVATVERKARPFAR